MYQTKVASDRLDKMVYQKTDSPSGCIKAPSAGLIATCALSLAIIGCGGGRGAPVANSDQESGENLQPSVNLSLLVTDAAALSTDEIPLRNVQYPDAADSDTDSNPLLVDPVIDPCSVIGAEEVSRIVNTYSGNVFSTNIEFNAGVVDGAVCTFSVDTHAIDVFINTETVVNSDIGYEVVPVGVIPSFDEPWPTNSAVTIYVDDLFGLRYVYGAHTSAGDFGVYVSNRGGTGFDGTDNGDPYAEIALAAASILSATTVDAGQTDGGSGDDGVFIPDVCSYWTRAELEVFLGYPLGEPQASDPFESGTIDCVYRGGANGLTLDVEVDPYRDFDPAGLIEIDGSVGIYQTDEQSVYVVLANAEYQVAIGVYESNGNRTLDTIPAATELARNIAGRVR